MELTPLERQLLADEGYRRNAYQDSLGYWTIGIGRLIDVRKESGITMDEALYLLRNDIAAKSKELDARIPWWRGMPIAKQEAVIQMAFQLGVSGLLGFRKALQALQDKNWHIAELEFLNSEWARQTPSRATRLAGVIGRTD